MTRINLMNMTQIIGLNIDYQALPKNRNSSMQKEAVTYRRALARASNAIEGVILSDKDKKFMDNIAPNMPKEDFKNAVLNHIASKQAM